MFSMFRLCGAAALEARPALAIGLPPLNTKMEEQWGWFPSRIPVRDKSRQGHLLLPPPLQASKNHTEDEVAFSHGNPKQEYLHS
ncbi:hypothetical protein D3C77_146800 [compost metagenome]